MQHAASVTEASLNIFASQSWVISEDLWFRPALRKELDDEFNRQAGSFNNRFSHKNRWIQNNAFLPFHFSPSNKNNDGMIRPNGNAAKQIQNTRHWRNLLKYLLSRSDWSVMQAA